MAIDVLSTEFRGDPTDLFATLREAQARITAVARNRVSHLRFRLNTSQAVREGTSLAVTLRAILRNRTIHVNIDRNSFQRGLAAAAGLFGRFATTVGTGVARIRKNLGGLGGLFSGLTSALSGAVKGAGGLTGAFGGLVGKMLLAVTFIPLLVSSTNALVGGFFALGGAIAPAAGLLATLPGLFGAAAAGGMALFFGLKGVLGAIKEGSQADMAGASASRKNAAATRDLSAAKRSVADAQRALNDVVRAYPEDVDDAQLSRRAAIVSEARAIYALKQAQEQLAQAQLKVRDASYETTTAVDAFSGKTYEIARQTVDTAKGSGDMRDALLGIREAQVALAQAQDTRQDSERSLQDLTRGGLKGTQGYRDAIRSLTRAKQDLVKQQKATTIETAKAPAAVDQYRQAMAKLSPEGRSFVRFIRGEWMPAFAEARRGIETNLLPPLETGLRRFMPTMRLIMDLLGTIAGDLGRAFRSAGTALATDEWQNRLTRVFDVLRPAVSNFARFIGNAFRGVSDLIIVADDLTGKVAGGLANATGRWADNMGKATKEGSNLRGFFDRAWSAATRTWQVIKNLTGTIINLGSIGRKAIGDDLLDSLVKLTQGWKDTTSSAGGIKKITAWFKEMKEPFLIIMNGVKKLTTWWAEFGASDGFKKQSTAIGDMGSALGRVIEAFDKSNILTHVLGAFALVATAIAKVTDLFGIWGLLGVIAVRKVATSLLATLGAAIGRVLISIGAMAAAHLIAMTRMAAAWLIGLGPIGILVAVAIAAVFLIIKHWDKIKKVVARIWESVKNVVSKFLGWVKDNWKTILPMLLGPIGIAVALIAKHWDKIKAGIGKVLGWIKDNWKTILAFLTGPIGLAVLVISRNWDKIKSGFGKVKDFFKEKIDAIKGYFTGIGDALGNLNWDTFKDGFKMMLNGILELWNGLDFQITFAVPDWVPKIGGNNWTSPDVFPDIAGFRKDGGDVFPGRSYVVGEERAEVFVPRTAGRIEPSVPAYAARAGANAGGGGLTKADLESLIAALKGARDVTLNVPVQKDLDPKVLSHELGWAMR